MTKEYEALNFLPWNFDNPDLGPWQRIHNINLHCNKDPKPEIVLRGPQTWENKMSILGLFGYTKQ